MAVSWISLPSSGTAAESFSMPSLWTASSSSESSSSAIAATVLDFEFWTVIYTSIFNIPLAASESLTLFLGCWKKKDINIWMLVESRIVWNLSNTYFSQKINNMWNTASMSCHTLKEWDKIWPIHHCFLHCPCKVKVAVRGSDCMKQEIS